MEKLHNLKVLVVGAGALGCEIMKSFALMGVGINGIIHLCDDDMIELSNLNRQFLFHKEHLGLYKAKCAKKAALEINPALNIKAYQIKVCPDTEEIFDEIFYENIDIVLPAVDTVAGRKYIDSKVTKHEKHMFDTGISGIEGNSTVFIPNLTSTYTDFGFVDTEFKKPSCTIKFIPSKFEDCIEWARKVFDTLFVDEINGVNTLINSIENYSRDTDRSALKNLHSLISAETSDN